MKKIILVVILLPVAFSCSKKKGCNAYDAINYDEMVVVDDGSCIYTKLAFYADRTALSPEIRITSTDVYINSDIIGSFSGAADAGGACGGSNSVIYATEGEGNISWSCVINLAVDTFDNVDSVYVFSHNSVAYNSGDATTSAGMACNSIDVLY